MTIQNTTSKIREDGNGVKSVFSFPFRLFSATDIEVSTILKSTGVATLKVLNTDYTVQINAITEGGTVTYITTVPSALEEFFATRVVPDTQPTDIPNVGSIREEQIETPLDRRTMVSQQQQEQIDRALTLAPGSTVNTITIANPVEGKGLFWQGDDLVNTVDDLNTIVADATAQAVLAAASAAAAATSETNAATSASAAAASATAAATSETNAATSATNAATSETNAATSATAAASSATAAAISATAAGTSATAAASSASAAATSASNAATSESNAAASATAAATSATNAATSESNAASSASAAATSASNASTSETNAATSATNAATSATNAATSESNAAASATAAATSETNAATSATAAAASAAQLTGTSATSLLIETASKVFTTQAGKFFDAGNFLLITSDADPTNFMHGQVTAYVGTTLTVNVTDIGGSGTFADWTIRVSGPAGADGAATNFLSLTDTPSNFTGDALKTVRVNAGETALEFVTPAAVSGGGLVFSTALMGG